MLSQGHGRFISRPLSDCRVKGRPLSNGKAKEAVLPTGEAAANANRIKEKVMQKISPCLWFRNEAEEAVDFYVSIFPNAKKGEVLRSGESGPGPAGSVVLVNFELFGQSFQALNGNSDETFNNSVSLSVDCKDQAEVDHYWEKLIDGRGKGLACSWLKDRYGVAWQIVPELLPRLLIDPDKAKAARVMAAMMKMVKIDVATIEEAARG
jgi:predicted 3-demethylubiquinone-9 3-methyltransferase (glyoxalase superfamily)